MKENVVYVTFLYLSIFLLVIAICLVMLLERLLPIFGYIFVL